MCQKICCHQLETTIIIKKLEVFKREILRNIYKQKKKIVKSIRNKGKQKIGGRPIY